MSEAVDLPAKMVNEAGGLELTGAHLVPDLSIDELNELLAMSIAATVRLTSKVQHLKNVHD